MHARRPLVVAIVFFGLSVLPARRASAAEPPAATASPSEAAAAKREGDDAFDSKHYEQAIAAYDRAYRQSHDPVLLFNRGRSFEAIGRFAQALVDFEAFRRDAPPALRARLKALDSLVEQTRARVARLTVTSNVTGARVTVRGQVLGAAPMHDVAVDSGPAAVVVEADGYLPFSVALPLTAGGTQEVDALLTRKPAASAEIAATPAEPVAPFVAPPPRPAEQPARSRPSRTTAYVTGGFGLAALGFAGAFGIATVVQDEKRAALVESHDYASARPWRERALNSRVIAAVAGGTALVALGATWILWRGGGAEQRDRRDASPRVSWTLTPQGISLDGIF